MNCPYCNRLINAMTGFQEVMKFQKHLGKCRKNPSNFTISDGEQTVVISGEQTLTDALTIRAESNQ